MNQRVVKPLFGNNSNVTIEIQEQKNISVFQPVKSKQLAEMNISPNVLKILEATKSPNGILDYGKEVMNSISQNSDKFLLQVNDSDAKYVTEQLSNIISLSQKLKFNDSSNSNIFTKTINKLKSNFVDAKEAALAEFNNTSTQMDRIVDMIDTRKIKITERLSMLQEMYEENKNDYDRLESLIKDLRDALEFLKKEKNKLEMDTDKDIFKIESINDIQETISVLDRRLITFEKLQMTTIQVIPDIRGLRKNGSLLLEKIETIKTGVIPQWKKSMTRYIANMDMLDSATVFNTIDEANNQMLLKGSELSKEAQAKIAKLSQRDIVDTSTLESIHNNILASVNEINLINEEGEKSRIESRTKMDEMKRLYMNM